MIHRLGAIALLLTSISCSGAATTTSAGETIQLSDLSGVWGNDSVVLRINDAGDFLVQPADSPEQVLMGGFVARDELRFIFVTGVSGECPGIRGAYTAGVDGQVLTLTLDEDPCDLRTRWFGETFSEVTE